MAGGDDIEKSYTGSKVGVGEPGRSGNVKAHKRTPDAAKRARKGGTCCRPFRRNAPPQPSFVQSLKDADQELIRAHDPEEMGFLYKLQETLASPAVQTGKMTTTAWNQEAWTTGNVDMAVTLIFRVFSRLCQSKSVDTRETGYGYFND